MQLFIPISAVDTNNIFFSEKRKNVILDGGYFVKIIYSTDDFEMNGLHLLLRLKTAKNCTQIPGGLRTFGSSDKPAKFAEVFDPAAIDNFGIIQALCNIERNVVDNYIALHAQSKCAVYNLKSQLISGSFRYSYEDPRCAESNSSAGSGVANYISTGDIYALKISGIWETNCNVGITVKFVRL